MKHVKFLVVAFAASFVAFPASADLVATNGAGDELRLFDRPCTTAAILDTLNPEYHAKFNAGQAIIGGKVIKVCWIDTEQGAYYVMPEGATEGVAYPVSIFNDKGI